jgi:hypothetical protein
MLWGDEENVDKKLDLLNSFFIDFKKSSWGKFYMVLLHNISQF